MARPLRIEFPGALYHVTSRGNGRADISLDDGDRQVFLDVLEAVCQRMNWLCYAYCLMTNHYHLVIETPEGNLAKGMRQLNGVYTQLFNRRHDHVGHVFQGRYKAILVDRDDYLLELIRYVVLNPVRAGMVEVPDQWPWSSYCATMGQEPVPPWLAQDWLLRQFARTREEARARHAQFVHDGQRHPSIWNSLRNQIYLGSEDFVAHMQARLRDTETLDEIPKVQRHPVPQSLQAFAEAHSNRRTAMAAAYVSGAYTMKAIAEYFGVHYSTVSRAVRRAENQKMA
jgi:REP element-mobilizing transposase RayT